MADFFVTWLIEGGVGPAAAALPVNFAANKLAGAAQAWFRRLRRADDLSRLVSVAPNTSTDLTDAEFGAVRRLLEDHQTWILLGQGTVEDLADRIASCLPPRGGRTAEESHAAAMTIARGLLEFAVTGLDSKLFQQVLLARLQRMETNQATALDQALLGLHADLSVGFTSVMEHLNRSLDRLPPGPAQQLEVVKYLKTLLSWLNTDPWPRDLQFNGPTLTLADIERKLRVDTVGRSGEEDLDADELAQQCQRLVILGGPGSGKTWLGKRTARRCAEDALRALAAGMTLDQVELPLYTTCSSLFSSSGDKGIREATVSSALSLISDLGGSRISVALSVFFAERNEPTLLIIDSLDEAHGSRERLYQTDTLPWRVILTSRPSSWNHQLVIEAGNESHRVGELQPLRYPDDVEPFVHTWFAGHPSSGKRLTIQIRQRPSLQQAATVPLILAFYCIVSGSEELPEFRHDLFTKVLKRMLTGRWRSDDDTRPDTAACLQLLRDWARSGATSHPVSGIGTWEDDIPTEPVRQSEGGEEALDHVAVPLAQPDVDTGKTLRRFVHRSIREHLLAEHVASLPVDQAAEVLQDHLWYDSDWEYVVPAAIAMHEKRDHLLRKLICRAANTNHIPADLSVIDARWEFRKLLARVATESREAEWPPEMATIIGQARVELARSGRTDNLGAPTSWPTSNRQAREALLSLLASENNRWMAGELVNGVVQLATTVEDKQDTRACLLRLLTSQAQGSVAQRLVAGILQLEGSPRLSGIRFLVTRRVNRGIGRHARSRSWPSALRRCGSPVPG